MNIGKELGIVLNLIVPNSIEAIEFYKKALSAKEVSKYFGPDGSIMHAAITINGEYFYLNDSNENFGAFSPNEIGGCPLDIWIITDDADELFKQAVEAGCEITMEMDDMFWGDRMGSLKDPYGYNWMISKTIEKLSDEEIEKQSKEFFKEMENMS